MPLYLLDLVQNTSAFPGLAQVQDLVSAQMATNSRWLFRAQAQVDALLVPSQVATTVVVCEICSCPHWLSYAGQPAVWRSCVPVPEPVPSGTPREPKPAFVPPVAAMSPEPVPADEPLVLVLLGVSHGLPPKVGALAGPRC